MACPSPLPCKIDAARARNCPSSILAGRISLTDGAPVRSPSGSSRTISVSPSAGTACASRTGTLQVRTARRTVHAAIRENGHSAPTARMPTARQTISSAAAPRIPQTTAAQTAASKKPQNQSCAPADDRRVPGSSPSTRACSCSSHASAQSSSAAAAALLPPLPSAASASAPMAASRQNRRPSDFPASATRSPASRRPACTAAVSSASSGRMSHWSSIDGIPAGSGRPQVRQRASAARAVLIQQMTVAFFFTRSPHFFPFYPFGRQKATGCICAVHIDRAVPCQYNKFNTKGGYTL